MTNATNLVPLFYYAFISTYYCLALQWILFHNERYAVLKFNRMSFYVTRTLLGVQYKLVNAFTAPHFRCNRNTVQHKYFIIKTINFVVIKVLHAPNRSCHYQACKNIYKEASCKSLHWSFHGLRAHPYSHIAIWLTVLNIYFAAA
jgi:hypothetical protein